MILLSRINHLSDSSDTAVIQQCGTEKLLCHTAKPCVCIHSPFSCGRNNLFTQLSNRPSNQLPCIIPTALSSRICLLCSSHVLAIPLLCWLLGLFGSKSALASIFLSLGSVFSFISQDKVQQFVEKNWTRGWAQVRIHSRVRCSKH